MDLKRKTSIIWNFFTPEELKASCNFCKQKFSYKSSTTNLKSHITRKHLSIRSDVLPKEKREHSTISQAASSECGTQTQEIHEPSPSPTSPTRKNIQIQNTDAAKPSTSTDSTEIHPPPVKKRRFHQTTISIPKKIGFSQKKNNCWH
jgi:hypothetical protein